MKDFDLEGHAARLVADGFTVIEDFLTPDSLAAARAGLERHLGTHTGRNNFEGFRTERVYTLVARAKVFEDITEDPRLLALLDRWLLPGYLVTASQGICIHPGETAQGVHMDDSFYRLPRPRGPASMSVIVAVDEFTATNGASEVIPGSHAWDQDKVDAVMAGGTRDLLQPVIMPAGGAIVFQGHLLHQGGANRSEGSRLAFTNQYCQPWGRTQENFFLGVPQDRVRAMSPRLQRLLGYDIWPPFMGHVTASHPLKALDPDWVAPVVADELKVGD